MKALTTDYSAITYKSPSRLKRWSHNLRFQQAIRVAAVRPGEDVLDFGAGDGHLLDLLVDQLRSGPTTDFMGKPAPALRARAARYVAFDPMFAGAAATKLAGRAEVVDSFDQVPRGGFDVVFTMEVIEHLRDPDTAIEQMKLAARDGARFVITVPIETGLPALLKNSLRKGLSKRDIANAVMGRTDRIERHELHPGYIPSHVGFNQWSIPPLLARHGLTIARVSYSPVPLLGPLLNSQVTFVAHLA